MTRKAIVGVGAVASFGVTAYMLLNTAYPAEPLYVSLFASSAAIGLIVAGWASAKA